MPDGLEKGLVAINAPAMWALGYTGYGTKVFVADTGVDPTHPAISIQYHGNYFPKISLGTRILMKLLKMQTVLLIVLITEPMSPEPSLDLTEKIMIP